MEARRSHEVIKDSVNCEILAKRMLSDRFLLLLAVLNGQFERSLR